MFSLTRLHCETAEPWEVQTNLARHHARINNMKPTVKTRGRRGPGPPRRKRTSLPGISPKSKGGRHSLPGGKRRTPKKAVAERPHKTSPELAQLASRISSAIRETSSVVTTVLKPSSAASTPPTSGSTGRSCSLKRRGDAATDARNSARGPGHIPQRLPDCCRLIQP